MRKHVLYLIILISITSCRKDYVSQTTIEDQFIPVHTFERNGHGFVTDENDVALSEVVLRVGGVEIETDQNGYFSFERIVIPSNGAYIEATKSGFFKGGHLINLESKNQDYIKISLASNQQQKIIPSSTGGVVVFENGIQLSIPSDAFSNGGNNYNGLIYAQCILINKDEERFAKLFPSSLLSYKENASDLYLQEVQGILAIELFDEFNNRLFLKPDKSIKVLVSTLQDEQILLIDNASYLEIDQGFWREASSDIDPQSEVEFFSLGWWALGSKRDKEKLCLNIKGPDTEVAAFSYVELKDLNNNVIWADYSDEEGTICDYVPKNQTLSLKVYDHCKINFEESTLDPINEELDLDYTFTNFVNKTLIQGMVFNCAAQALNQGYIIFNQNEIPTYIPVVGGSYEYSNYCSNQDVIQAKVVDSESGFYRNFDMTVDQQTLGENNFYLCGSDADFMLFNIENSATKGFSDCKVLQNPDETLIIAKATDDEYFIIGVSEFTTGTFPATVFSSEGIADNGEVSITIDNYPQIDEIMLGTIEGALEGKSISGNFAAKRIK